MAVGIDLLVLENNELAKRKRGHVWRPRPSCFIPQSGNDAIEQDSVAHIRRSGVKELLRLLRIEALQDPILLLRAEFIVLFNEH